MGRAPPGMDLAMRAAFEAARMACGLATIQPPRCHAWVMAEPEAESERVTVPREEFDQLLAVATMYVGAFTEDEMMTLPEKFAFQEVEAILGKYGKRY